MKKLILFIIISFLLVILNIVQWSFNSIQKQTIKNSSQWIHHTYEVILMASDVKSQIEIQYVSKKIDLEALGYRLKNLQNMVNDNPTQVRRISNIEKAILDRKSFDFIDTIFDEFINIEKELLKKRNDHLKNL